MIRLGQIIYPAFVTLTLTLTLCVFFTFATPGRSDLVDDPADESGNSTNKEPTKPGTNGLQHDDNGNKGPVSTPAPSSKGKDKDKDEKSPDQRKPTKGEKPAEKGPEKAPAGSNTPIKFRSERMDGQKDGGILVLEENVVVTQADMRIEADKATLHFDQATNEVIDCIAVGHVYFRRTDPETGQLVTAEGKEADFNNRERTVLLKGDPKLVRGNDVVRGRQIRYDLVTGWVKADRVEGVVQPTKQDNSKSGTTPSKSPTLAKPELTPGPKKDANTSEPRVELKEGVKP